MSACIAATCTIDGIPIHEWIRVPVVDDEGKEASGAPAPQFPALTPSKGGIFDPSSWGRDGGASEPSADGTTPGQSYATCDGSARARASPRRLARGAERELSEARPSLAFSVRSPRYEEYFAALETYNKAKQGRYKTKRAAEKDLSSRSGGQRQTSRGVKPGLKVFKMQPDGTWAQTL